MVLGKYYFDTGFPVYIHAVHYRKGIVDTASWFTELLILKCFISPQIYEDLAVVGFPYSGLKDILLYAV